MGPRSREFWKLEHHFETNFVSLYSLDKLPYQSYKPTTREYTVLFNLCFLIYSTWSNVQWNIYRVNVKSISEFRNKSENLHIIHRAISFQHILFHYYDGILDSDSNVVTTVCSSVVRTAVVREWKRRCALGTPYTIRIRKPREGCH